MSAFNVVFKGEVLPGQDIDAVKRQFGSLKSSSRHKVLGYGVHIPGNVFPSDL